MSPFKLVCNLCLWSKPIVVNSKGAETRNREDGKKLPRLALFAGGYAAQISPLLNFIYFVEVI